MSQTEKSQSIYIFGKLLFGVNFLAYICSSFCCLLSSFFASSSFMASDSRFTRRDILDADFLFDVTSSSFSSISTPLSLLLLVVLLLCLSFFSSISTLAPKILFNLIKNRCKCVFSVCSILNSAEL